MITKNHLIIFLVVTTIITVLFSGYNIRKNRLYNTELKKQFNDRIQTIEGQLEITRRTRDSLNNIVSSLKRSLADLYELDSLKTIELDSIKGVFDELSPSDLEKKMIEEYKKATK